MTNKYIKNRYKRIYTYFKEEKMRQKLLKLVRIFFIYFDK